MAGLVLIHNPQEWLSYTQDLAQRNNVPLNQIAWGAGPQKYPCLVASMVQPPARIVSCYVYPEEATKLVEAAGLRVFEVQHAATPVAAEVAGHTQAEFARSVAAHLLALYHELESVKITHKERYEQLYTEYLAMVDQNHAADKEALAGLSEGQRFILRGIFPRDEDGRCEGA